MRFRHSTQRLPQKLEREKPNQIFTVVFVSFISLYRMFTIQYKVFTNLLNVNSKTRIRKPWAKKCLSENHPLENRQKQPKIKTIGGSISNRCWFAPISPHRIHIVDMVLDSNKPKPTRGALAGYPPSVQVHRTYTLVKLHAKNVKHIQQSPTCCFLCIQGEQIFLDQQSREEIPIVSLHQNNFSVLTDFANESTTSSKVPTFSSNTLSLSTMSLTK